MGPRILILGTLLLCCGLAAAQQNEAAKHHAKQGRKRMVQRDFEGAIQSYNQAILLEPYNANLYYARGQAKHFNQDVKGAIADYGKAIYYLPGHHRAFHMRGLAYFGQGKLKDAMADLDEAVKLRPKFAMGYNTRARVLGEMGKDEEAQADCTEAIRINKTFHQAFFNRANAKLRQGKFESAQGDLDRAIAIAPRVANYHFQKAETLVLQGQLLPAIQTYTAALEMKDGKRKDGSVLRARPLHPIVAAKALAARARIRYLRGDKGGAKQDLELANKRVGDFAYPALWLAGFFDETKPLAAYADATGWTKVLVRFHQGKASAEQVLAEAQQKPKDEAFPEKVQRQHLCEAYCYLGLRQERAGKTQEALALYRKALATKVYLFAEFHWSKLAVERLAKSPAKAPSK